MHEKQAWNLQWNGEHISRTTRKCYLSTQTAIGSTKNKNNLRLQPTDTSLNIFERPTRKLI